MRHFHALLAALAVWSLVGWELSAPPAGVAAAGPAQAAPAPASTATITVTTYDDEWHSDTDPASASTKCSLREALQLVAANGNRGCGATSPAATTVILDMRPGTYRLTREERLPDLGSGKTVSITGPDIVIDGGSQNASRHFGIFHLVNGGLALKDLTLQAGSRQGGGAVWQDGGVFTADKVTFKDNDAAADNTLTQDGGAILVDTGDLTVTNSIFQNNVAVGAGGAVSTAFGYFFKDKFIGNRASAGGAFEDRSPTTFPVKIVQSEFKDNKARPLPFNDPSPGYQPYSDPYGGGAIFNYGNLRVDKTLIEDNHSELTHGGGGLENHGTAILTECVFTKNTAVANGSGDSNANISIAWGGAIINYGDLDLVRCSVHGNQADYAGAIFNHGNGDLHLYNTTVTNNTAKQFYGGLVNEMNVFGNTNPSAAIYLVHATIGKNNSSGVGPGPNVLYAQFNRSIWFANSILDAACSNTQYTYGRSVMTELCDTMPDPHTLFAGTDLSKTAQSLVGLQSLTGGNSQVAEFKVQPLNGNSIAVDIGVDDQFTCANPNINHQDQNQAPRAVPCDAGAIESGQAPPQFSSTPGPGLVQFPVVDFTAGKTSSTTSLVLKNAGGGAMTYEVVDEGGSAGGFAVTNQSPATGTLFKNQQTTLQFLCTPPAVGDHWKNVSIQTNAPNQKIANYKFRCTAVGQAQLASMSDPPGPLNMPMPLPGQTGQASVSMSNPGHMPLNTSYGWMNPNPAWTLMPMQAAGQAPSGPASTLAPGQTLQLNLACTPPGTGVLLNTLVITTNDPINPSIHYDAACQAQVTNPAEALHPATGYNTPSLMEGIAASPDGAQVLAGQVNDNLLRLYDRDPATGHLTAAGTFSRPGMAAIRGIQYSHDGRNVYYTSEVGNGVVVADRNGNNLSASEVITSGTRYQCGIVNHVIVFCPINLMHGAHNLAVSPDDQYVYVTGYADGTLSVFRRQADGTLTFTQGITRTIDGANVLGGADRVTTSPDGAHVYVAAFTDDTVAVFQRDASGRLYFQAAYKDGVGGINRLNAPADIAVSPDGKFVYITSSGDNALNIFNRSSADGGLSLSSVITGVTGAWGLALTHDDAARRLFLAQYTGDKVQVYGRDATSGALNLVGTYSNVTGTSNVDGPVFLAVSPDNQDLYASLFEGQAVRLFQTVHNTPVLGQLSPASAVAGSGTFLLRAVGGRFYPDSQIVWAGTPMATNFIGPDELQALIPAASINATGNFSVLVRNSTPGGGDSAALNFASTGPAATPVPSIESLDPPEASFGGDADLVVLVQGANFAPDAQVYYNHSSVPTLFINDHTLQITLGADLLTESGTGGLEVTNGGGAPALSGQTPNGPDAPDAAKSSVVVGFTVRKPGRLAAPSADSLTPSSVISGSAPLWVTVTGHNFSTDPAAETVGRWNGADRVTVVVDANTLLLELTQADLATPGNGQVTVFTPGPGESAPLTFRVRLPSEKPVPVVSSVAPEDLTVYVNGSDFDPGATIRVNGAARATTFINDTQLKMTVTSADHGGLLTVFNPGPGGGLSNGLVAVYNFLFLPLVRR